MYFSPKKIEPVTRKQRRCHRASHVQGNGKMVPPVENINNYPIFMRAPRKSRSLCVSLQHFIDNATTKTPITIPQGSHLAWGYGFLWFVEIDYNLSVIVSELSDERSITETELSSIPFHHAGNIGHDVPKLHPKSHAAWTIYVWGWRVCPNPAPLPGVQLVAV
jgi:hypothetical protein